MAREFRIEGIDDAIRNIKAFEFRTNQGVKNAVNAAVLDLDRENKKRMTEMIYDQPESPSYVRTGRLRSGFKWLISIGGRAAEYFTHTNYAQYVHDGTSKMPPRPFLQDAFDAIRPSFVKKIDDAVKAAERKAALGGV